MRYAVRGGLSIMLGIITALALGGCSRVHDVIGPTTHITADFRSIAGMFEGNPVTVLGLEVGTVDKIVPHDQYAEVHIAVDGDVNLPANVTATVVSQSIVTDRHIELSPAYTGGPTLVDRSHLTVAQTRSPVELDTMLQTIDRFTADLKPAPGNRAGPLSGTLLYDMVNGQGAKIRDTLAALSGALKVGVADKDAISTIIVKLNDLTSTLADNDQSVRDFSDKITQMFQLLAEQAPGLQATLDQLNAVLADSSGTFGKYRDQLADSLTGLTAVARQLRANAANLTEAIDVAPLTLQNLDRLVDRPGRFARGHLELGTIPTGEIVTLFCQRIQMRADGCRTGKVEDLGPDFGLTAALLGITN